MIVRFPEYNKMVDLHSWTSSIPITNLDRYVVDCK